MISFSVLETRLGVTKEREILVEADLPIICHICSSLGGRPGVELLTMMLTLMKKMIGSASWEANDEIESRIV